MMIHYTIHCTFRALFRLSMLSLLIFISHAKVYAKPANVLVSIKPLHSLISHITDGINQTELLLQQQQSPHNFQLRPSQKRLLNQADIFFYSSDNIESFVPPLKSTNAKLQFVQLSRIADIQALPTRSFHSHEPHKSQNTLDGHIWLSIENAKIIAEYVTETLSKNSPENATHYHQNLYKLLLKLQALKHTNLQLLKQYRETPFMVYHDAFQYFELENHLSKAHFITTSPEHSPGIKRVKALRDLISAENIQCIFYEPPNIPSLLKTLTENKSVKLAALDPVGLQIPMGKAHYSQLMRQTATTLEACFTKK